MSIFGSCDEQRDVRGTLRLFFWFRQERLGRCGDSPVEVDEGDEDSSEDDEVEDDEEEYLKHNISILPYNKGDNSNCSHTCEKIENQLHNIISYFLFRFRKYVCE